MTPYHLAAHAAGIALLLLHAAGAAGQAAPSAPVGTGQITRPATALKPFKVLNAADVSPAVLLPPPPLAGSPAEAVDLAEVRRTVAAETSAQLTQAQSDDAHEDPSIFDGVIGGGFEARQLPATWALLKLVASEASIASGSAKRYFHRARPYAIDPSVRRCGANAGVVLPTSYPSGHATLGYSIGLTLATLLPEKARVIEARAGEYAEHRIVCGVHYRTDIEGGHVVGVVVATQLLAASALQAMIMAARAELLQAHFTRQ
jgi:acid phosphatase (class A)